MRYTNLASFHCQLVVYTRREIVKHNHFAVGRQAVFFFDANTHQRFDRRTARDASHTRYRSIYVGPA